MQKYWDFYVKQEQARRYRLAQHQHLDWKTAHECATILKMKYQASQVVLLGSMLHRIHEYSDIDLTV